MRDRNETNPIPHGVLVNGTNDVAALDRRPVRPKSALKVSYLVLSRRHSSVVHWTRMRHPVILRKVIGEELTGLATK